MIESASETAHYPMLNRGAFLGLDLPWLELDYIDESDLDALLAGPVEHQYAALVLTPGAVALPGVRTILERRSAELAHALTSGVGVVITATTLGGVERFDLTFLPEGSQVSLVDTGMREMTGILVTDSLPDDVLAPADGQRACSALTLTSKPTRPPSNAYARNGHKLDVERPEDDRKVVDDQPVGLPHRQRHSHTRPSTQGPRAAPRPQPSRPVPNTCRRTASRTTARRKAAGGSWVRCPKIRPLKIGRPAVWAGPTPSSPESEGATHG